MRMVKVLIIFSFIFFLIINLSGSTIAEMKTFSNFKITVDEWGNIKIKSLPEETSNIFQTGRFNLSFQVSTDITNYISILQSGQYNYNYVEQSGAFNQAQVRQEGSNNIAVISQNTEKKDTKEEDKGEEE